MAGSPKAMFRPTEGAEDDPQRAVRDLRRIRLSRRDVLVGISAGGRTPYTLAGMRYARRVGTKTIALTMNPSSPIRRLADVAIAPVVGPEVIAGSTRMKAGTAQKLVLNMLSTASMVRLGRVLSHWMVTLRLNSEKLRKRGQAILMKATGVRAAGAAAALKQSGGNLPAALLMLWNKTSQPEALRLLGSGKDTASVLRTAWTEQAQVSSQKRRSCLTSKGGHL